MSGVLALARVHGGQPSSARLGALAETMAFRGPAGVTTWHDAHVGLAHAALAETLPAHRLDRQPASIDGTSWIVADARLDNRDSVRARLVGLGESGAATAGDSLLLLHAFRAWGEDGFARLLGDFAGVIWLPGERRLLAFRDPLGVRPLYHARVGELVAVSNTLSTLLALPALDRGMDDAAIGDFLLFDAVEDPEATPFRSIRQVPPATLQWWSPNGRGARRYWSFEDLSAFDTPAADASAATWQEAFFVVLRQAVADRVTTSHAAALMSGGLDSTAVAVLAGDELGDPARLALHTMAIDAPDRDVEAIHAARVAADLGARHRVHDLGSDRFLEGFEDLAPPPLLLDHTFEAARRDVDRALAADSPVVLTGYGGDSLLRPDTHYFTRAVRTLRLGRAWHYLRTAPRRSDRRLPPLGLHAAWERFRLVRGHRRALPAWLDTAWAAGQDLEQRWIRSLERKLALARDPPARYAASIAGWNPLFEQLDSGARAAPIEYRHPFFDLRLVALAAELPPVPFRVEKDILREAMRNRMPEAVRCRPKTGILGFRASNETRRASDLWHRWMRETPEIIERYVNPRGVLDALRTDEAGISRGADFYRWEVRRPLSLGLCLRSLAVG